jgi:hypothetical protein
VNSCLWAGSAPDSFQLKEPLCGRSHSGSTGCFPPGDRSRQAAAGQFQQCPRSHLDQHRRSEFIRRQRNCSSARRLARVLTMNELPRENAANPATRQSGRQQIRTPAPAPAAQRRLCATVIVHRIHRICFPIKTTCAGKNRIRRGEH